MEVDVNEKENTENMKEINNNPLSVVAQPRTLDISPQQEEKNDSSDSGVQLPSTPDGGLSPKTRDMLAKMEEINKFVGVYFLKT